MSPGQILVKHCPSSTPLLTKDFILVNLLAFVVRPLDCKLVRIFCGIGKEVWGSVQFLLKPPSRP